SLFFFTHHATPELYTLSLHDALPILAAASAEVVIRQVTDRVEHDVADQHEHERQRLESPIRRREQPGEQRRLEGDDENDAASRRSEEHTSELQSQSNLVCRLLLEKKK